MHLSVTGKIYILEFKPISVPHNRFYIEFQATAVQPLAHQALY